MQRFRTIYILILAIVLLLGSLPAAAVERPFSLHGVGIATFTGGNPPTGANVTASGRALRLGQWVATGAVSFSPAPAPGLILVNGQATFTAANGDELHVELTDAVLDTTTSISTGIYLFVGGTGRFEAVSGSAKVVVMQNPNGSFEVTAIGSIDY